MPFELLCGDVRERLLELPANSVHMVVTSPPYWGLREYGTAEWTGGSAECKHEAQQLRRGLNLAQSEHSTRGGAKHVAEAGWIQHKEQCPKCGALRTDLQMGLEPTPEQFIERMVRVFREVRRVLREDGTLWLNMGDSYHNGDKGGYERSTTGKQRTSAGTVKGLTPNRLWQAGLKPKDLIGMPWRLALALQADGWYLRSDIIWHKPNPMPESVEDRPTKSHEHLFLLSKCERYFYDAVAIEEPASGTAHARGDGVNPRSRMVRANSRQLVDRDPRHLQSKGVKQNESFSGAVRNLVDTRNKRDVWTIATAAFELDFCQACHKVYEDADTSKPCPACGQRDWLSHFATFPTALVEPCILAGSAEKTCAVCRAPWKRLVEPSPEYAQHLGKGKRMNGYDYDKDAADGMAVNRKVNAEYITLGFVPSCKCGSAEVAPSVILDPFNGSGTSGVVATRFHRSYIGIDLNPRYLTMARYRIEEDAPLFNRQPVTQEDVCTNQSQLSLLSTENPAPASIPSPASKLSAEP